MSQFEVFCSTCGVTGESNFSTNDLDESTCNICGAQNYHQSRNEVFEYEDVLIQGMASRGRKVGPGGKRGRKRKDKHVEKPLVTIENCLHVSQTVLHLQATALATILGDPEIVDAARDVWFYFLEQWSQHGGRPLLNCFLSFAPKAATVRAGAALVEAGYETQWDYDLKRGQNYTQLCRFNLRSHLALLYIACRLRHVGILTSDLFVFVRDGRLPYTNLLPLLPQYMRAQMMPIQEYFNTNYRQLVPSTSTISAEVSYLVHHLDLTLPAFNAAAAFETISSALCLPPAVTKHFYQLLALAPPDTTSTEASAVPLRFLPCEADFVARVVMSIKLTPGWHLWKYEVNADAAVTLTFPTTARQPTLKRKHLQAFVATSSDVRCGQHAKVLAPASLDNHILLLRQIATEAITVATVSPHPVASFAPVHAPTGEPLRASMPPGNDEADFYPHYKTMDTFQGRLHSAMERVILELAEYMDMPARIVLESMGLLESVALRKTGAVFANSLY
ncbi:hypothetical protein ACHHYP_10354 [Achlya hypogyna]|uniref:Rrn7/TAF1B N-terminal cyclin domain-containing protein n=1 Tax=Achlya hypogyna TaxID=1202772 RepID=A0A1V9YLM8_ACHHY|nr:hypothetical protein ACHHYP_10354 [Achlya hypogyna]